MTPLRVIHRPGHLWLPPIHTRPTVVTWNSRRGSIDEENHSEVNSAIRMRASHRIGGVSSFPTAKFCTYGRSADSGQQPPFCFVPRWPRGVIAGDRPPTAFASRVVQHAGGFEAASNCSLVRRVRPDWKRYASWTDAYGRNVPIRCGYWNGVRGWGVQKLKAKSRWNVWYRGMIGATLENPRDRWAQNPTTDIYVTRWFTECDPVYRFRVVVNTSRKSGHAGMMGVVNAYMEFR